MIAYQSIAQALEVWREQLGKPALGHAPAAVAAPPVWSEAVSLAPANAEENVEDRGHHDMQVEDAAMSDMVEDHEEPRQAEASEDLNLMDEVTVVRDELPAEYLNPEDEE